MLLLPAPNAAYAVAGIHGKFLPFVLSHQKLHAHLVQFTKIRLPHDDEMFFAFWDPGILGTLVGQPDDATMHVP